MLSHVMLSVIMLSVIMINVIMLSVVAPTERVPAKRFKMAQQEELIFNLRLEGEWVPVCISINVIPRLWIENHLTDLHLVDWHGKRTSK